MPEVKQILCADGHTISATLFKADAAKAQVIVAAAIGIPQKFYRRYAEYLAEQGYDVITFNYRGTGDSKSQDLGQDIRLEDWGHQDIQAIISFAIERQQKNPVLAAIHYVGHSIGGQLVGLASNAEQLDSLTLVAASAPYWQRWSFPKNLKMWLVGQILIPGISAISKDFPAQKVGLGSITFPSSAAKQWAQWMGRPAYLFCENFNLDTRHYSSLKQPLRSYGFTDDDLAPEINVRSLLNFFPKAKSELRMTDHKALGLESLGHSGFFREFAKETLWNESVEWFEQAAA